MIRPYNPADKSSLLRILRLNTPEFFAPSEESDFIHYLEHELEHYFVIEGINRVLGGGGFNFLENGKVVRISWDLLDPEFQKKGLGSRLLRYRLDEIKKFSAVEQVVVRTSQLACLFYEKAGFQTTEVTKDYWADGLDLHYMVLKHV